jgi:hypothetical protein
MYLPYELDPQDIPRYAVVHIARTTGAREITYISTSKDAALGVARAGGDFVIELAMIGDYR